MGVCLLSREIAVVRDVSFEHVLVLLLFLWPSPQSLRGVKEEEDDPGVGWANVLLAFLEFVLIISPVLDDP